MATLAAPLHDLPAPTYAEVNRDIIATLAPPGKRWYAGMALILAGLAFGGLCWALQLKDGLGITGYTPPIFWGTYITTFVFWVGIAHSGTLISAILLLFRSGWRTSIYRASEAMTVFAVMTAALFPLVHLGRFGFEQRGQQCHRQLEQAAHLERAGRAPGRDRVGLKCAGIDARAGGPLERRQPADVIAIRVRDEDTFHIARRAAQAGNILLNLPGAARQAAINQRETIGVHDQKGVDPHARDDVNIRDDFHIASGRSE